MDAADFLLFEFLDQCK